MLGVQAEMDRDRPDEAAGEDLRGEHLESAALERVQLTDGEANRRHQLLSADVSQFAFPAKFFPELPWCLSGQLQIS